MSKQTIWEERIRLNLVSLSERLCSVPKVLNHLFAKGIITSYEVETIKSEKTDTDKASELFKILQKKDLDQHIETILVILNDTGNDHLSKILISDEKVASEEKPLNSKWWPRERPLVRSYYDRKYENGEDMIEELRKTLISSETSTTVISHKVAVPGFGGIGKTVTATKYAKQYEETYNYIIWLDCGEGSLKTTFELLVDSLKLKVRVNLTAEMAGTIFGKLNSYKCLVIFDNAECYIGNEGIQSLLPYQDHSNIHTIITSRSPYWGNKTGLGCIALFMIGTFQIAESVEFLKAHLQDQTQSELEMKKLCQKLGNLPLALQIAIDTMNVENMSLSDYNAEVEENYTHINTPFDDCAKSINEAMNVSLNKITAKRYGMAATLALQILSTFGYIQPDNIPLEFFHAVENFDSGKTKIPKLKEAVKILEQYSLITKETKIIDGTGITFLSVHRLLQQVIRYKSQNENKEVITLKKIINIDGFFDYKIIACNYAGEHDDLKEKLTDLKQHLVEVVKLNDLVFDHRFDEAVTVAKIMDEDLNSHISQYNLAICLLKNGALKDAVAIFDKIYQKIENVFSDTFFGTKEIGEIDLKIVERHQTPNKFAIATTIIFLYIELPVEWQKSIITLRTLEKELILGENSKGNITYKFDEKDIRKNLAYLCENLRNIDQVLLYFIQKGVISSNGMESIRSNVTQWEKSKMLFMVLLKKHLPDNIADIFNQTNNEHLVHQLTQNRVEDCQWWPNELNKILFKPNISILEKVVEQYSVGYNKLHEKLRSHPHNQLVISGLPGVGKKTLAKLFARHNQDKYHRVINVDCSNLVMTLSKLAQWLGIINYILCDLKNLASQICQKLSKFKCLFLFHNAHFNLHDDVLKIFSQWRHFRVVITTTDDQWESSEYKPCILHTPNKNDCIQFLKDTLRIKDPKDKDIGELASLLQYSPLLLQISASTILTFATVNITDYIKMISKSIGSHDQMVDSNQNAAFHCLSIFLQLVSPSSKENICDTVIEEILKTLAYIPSHDIDFQFLIQVHKTTENQMVNAVKVLSNASIVELNTKINTTSTKISSLTISSLLQHAIRRYFKSNEKETIETILGSTSDYFEYRKYVYMNYGVKFDELKYLFLELESQSYFYDQMLNELRMGNYKRAAEIAVKLQSKLKNKNGYNHALCLEKMGKLEESVRILEYIFQTYEFTEIPTNVLKRGYNINGSNEIEFYVSQPDEMPPKFVTGVNCCLQYERLSQHDGSLKVLQQLVQGYKISVRNLCNEELRKMTSILCNVSIKIVVAFDKEKSDDNAKTTLKEICRILNIFNTLMSKPSLGN